VRAGSLTSRFPYFLERHDGGTVYVDMSGPRLAGGAGSLIELVVRINANASSPLTIDFQSAALNEGHLTIGVLPQAGSDPTDGLIVVAAAGVAEASTDTLSAPTFFAAFKARLSNAASRLASFFGSDEAAPPAPVVHASVDLKAKPAAAPVIDLSGRLPSFTVAGNDGVTGQLSDGQNWKRDLAGVSADQPTDPNSKLQIPVSIVTTRPVSGT
jgi:hypothetical protein